MSERLIEPEFLARLEYLYVLIKNMFIGHMAAERISKKFGVGQEFADFRTYIPGDDFRRIDWSVYARQEALVVKLFAEEQEVPIYLALDASLSMSLGKPEKFLYAKKVAAALGYIGLANLDPVIVVPFDQRMRAMSREFREKGQLMGLLRFLEQIPAAGATDMAQSFREFLQQQPRRGLVVVLSDFFDHRGYGEMLRLLHHHRFDLCMLRINSSDEVDPKLGGDVELVDSETQEKIVVKLTPVLIERYRARFAEHYSELERLSRLLRGDYVSVVTDFPLDRLVLDVFRRGGFLR